jgi:hypothetical protein
MALMMEIGDRVALLCFFIRVGWLGEISISKKNLIEVSMKIL